VVAFRSVPSDLSGRGVAEATGSMLLLIARGQARH